MQLKQIAQHADDLDRAARFYESLFQAGPTAVFDPPGLLFFTLGSQRLLLDRAAPPALLYFEVDDLRATMERLERDGVVITAASHLIFTHADDTLGPAGREEWQAFVQDSEGNMVGLIELRPMDDPSPSAVEI